jgi:prepilin-type N-terminal cleavage/methylation domain-containing protein
MNTQKGVTLVELVIAIAVTGIIVAFLGTAVHQITTVTGYGNDKLTALHELQNAAYWFNRDGQRAASASVDSGLLLTITGGSSISYVLSGSELRRTAGGDQMVLAKNIAGANFSISDRTVTMSLTSAPEGRDNVTESRTYMVTLRPAEAE